MTRPKNKRGFRPMTVNDEIYHWRITWFEGRTLLEIQHASVRGQQLIVDLHAKPVIDDIGRQINHTDDYAPIVVRPKFVRESVLYALEHGWTPQVVARTLKIDAHEAKLPFVELAKSPFDAVIDEIISQTPPIDDTSMQGFTVDLIHAVSDERYVLNVKTQRCDDPRCMIIASGTLSPSCRVPLLVGEFMKKQWLEKICYKGFEAHQIVYKPHTIDFRFVTINKTANYCVTGKIVIERY